MKDALKFVQGAVSRKDFVPALKHVNIQDKVIQAFNGSIALSSPINFEHNLSPVAQDFIRAVNNCVDNPSIEMTKAGRLKVSEGLFKVFINVLDNAVFPSVFPTGEKFTCDINMMNALETLAPFIGTDAAKPWSMGVILRGGYAYATNNVVLACYTTPIASKVDIIIPKVAVDELLRIKQPIIAMQIDNTSATFHFEGDKWLRTNLIDSNAPDFYPVFAKCSFLDEDLKEIPVDLPARLERMKPFIHPKAPTIIFRKEGMFTDQGEEGASDTEYSFPLAVFRFEPLMKVLERARRWDLSTYPAPCAFTGINISGVIVGQKVVAREV